MVIAAQEIILGADPYLNFINSLKSDATKRGYRNSLVRFMHHFAIKDTITLSKLPTKDIELYLIKYFEFLKQQKRSVRSMDCMLNAVEHFCVMNDILINSRKVSKFKSPEKKQNLDKAYTHQDLQKLVNMSSNRVKLIVLIYASTGVRKSALPSMKFRHLQKIDNLYKLTIYEGEKEQYFTFCTPECAALIDQYLDFRRRSGENLTDDSPLIREEFVLDVPIFPGISGSPVYAMSYGNEYYESGGWAVGSKCLLICVLFAGLKYRVNTPGADLSVIPTDNRSSSESYRNRVN